MSGCGLKNTFSNVYLCVLNKPDWVVCISSLLIIISLYFIPQIEKDVRSDAFLAKDNPALVYRDKVKEQFGLSDPLVIALVDEREEGVFNPQALAIVQQLSDAVSDLDNIDYSRVVSLATEKNIRSTPDGMAVTPFFDPLPETQAQSDELRKAIGQIPLYMGTLVSKSGKATLIVAELIDDVKAEQSYLDMLELVAAQELPLGVTLHVAGEGAITGYLGRYVDADAKRLNPLTCVIIFLVILLAYRRLSPALLSLVVIAASVLITLGVMAASGVPFFVITNALPVILIGISVADAIHIFSHYFDLQAKSPKTPVKDLVLETMAAMWRPITLTTLTTMAGFLGLYLAAYMPPFQAFGLFCALGVALAWLYSLTFLPAAMVLIKPKISPVLLKSYQQRGGDAFSRMMAWLGDFTYRHGQLIIGMFFILAVAGGYATSHLRVDEDRIDIFHPSETIYQADKAINKYMDGTNTLDIVVEASVFEGLFELDALKRMESLQLYAESLPHVQGSTSIVDYLKQINRALNGGSDDQYRLPGSSDLVAQYFLIYSATSDPTDFEEEIDYDYQTANIRINMNSGGYQDIKLVVESLNRYIEENVNNQAVHATLSGRVNLNYHWIKGLAKSHFTGLAFALGLVFLVSSFLFRSWIGGVYALIPVAGSVLLVYATMVVFGVHLGVGTSMFAAVAIGLGVDFSIHTLDRFRYLFSSGGDDMEAIFKEFYTTTGRALLFNFLAISCGFGVLMVSKISSLNNFGAIVALAVSVSFLASMTLLPALIKQFRPAFIVPVSATATGSSSKRVKLNLSVGWLLVTLSCSSLLSLPIFSADLKADPLSADEIVARINQVGDGDFLTRKLSMKTVDKRGKERRRETIIYRKEYADETRTVLFYLSPSNVRNTGFLAWDYNDQAKDDDQWLYLPALRKVRRIASADRGGYFLGTDFTYDDIQLDGKLEPRDYNFTLVGEEPLLDIPSYRMSSTPKTKEIAKELGYGRTEFWVDKSSWMVLKVEFWDLKNKPLKRMTTSDIKPIGHILTRHGLHVINHKTGHQTQFTFSDVDYKTPVKDSWFTKRALSRGH